MDRRIGEGVWYIYTQLLNWCYAENNRVKASKLRKLADKYRYVYDNSLYLKKWR